MKQQADGVIQVKNLSKEYKMASSVIHALRNINLEIAPKSYTILFGPSGSGKTTFLNLVGFIDVPTKGDIFLEGVSASKLSRLELAEFRLRHIGFIFQKFYLLEELSAVENVLLPAAAKDGFSHKAVKKAESLLDLVGLKHRLKHKPRHLSEGEKQGVAIARSLINEPHILLCDEPTASLDAENSTIVLELLKKINSEKGVTIFLVTHDERQLQYADKIFYISDGSIVKEAKHERK
jgi:ABC-type lipoprotein export system ATPase subunit